MTLYPDSQHALYFSEVASFGATAPTGSDTWTQIQVEAPSTIVTTPGRDSALEANAQGIDSLPVSTGKQRTALSAVVKAWTGNKARGNGETAVSFHLQKLLESYFGAAATGTAFVGTQVAAGTHSTTGATLDDATDLAVGDLFMLNGQVRRLVTVNTGTGAVTWDIALSAAPVENDWVYGAFHLDATLGQYAKHIYVQTQKGEGNEGAGPGKINALSFAGTAGEIAKWTLGFAGLARNAGVSISSPVANPFVYQPISGLGGEAHVDAVARCFGDHSTTFNVMHDELTCNSEGTFQQGASGWGISKRGVSGTFNAYHDADYWTKNYNGASVPLRLVHWAGGAASHVAKARGAIVFDILNAQLTVTRSTLNNFVGVNVSWVAGPLTAAQLAAGYTQPFRVGIFGGLE